LATGSVLWQLAQAIAVAKGCSSIRREAKCCGQAAEPKLVGVGELGEVGVEDVVGAEVEAPPPPPPPPEQPALNAPTRIGRLRKVVSETPE